MLGISPMELLSPSAMKIGMEDGARDFHLQKSLNRVAQGQCANFLWCLHDAINCRIRQDRTRIGLRVLCCLVVS